MLANWPEHAIADHGHLALIRADQASGTTWDVRTTPALIRKISQPMIREEAAMLATNIRRSSVGMDADLLDAVAEIQDSTAANELRLSSWAQNRAVALEDWPRANAWSARTATTLADACAVPEPHHTLICDERHYEVRDVVGRLVALGERQAQTWQESMVAAGWRCHLGGSEHEGLSKTHATWTGELWQFDEWDSATDGTRCLANVGRTEEVPEGPLKVSITLEGPTTKR